MEGRRAGERSRAMTSARLCRRRRRDRTWKTRHLEHILQVVHHAAVLDIGEVVYVNADSRRGGAILRVVIVAVSAEVRANHVHTFDLIGRIHVPWIADPDSAVELPGTFGEEDTREAFALREALRAEAPVMGQTTSCKPATIKLHNLLKTGADSNQVDILALHPDTAGRGARFNLLVDVMLVGATVAVKAFAVHQAAKVLGALEFDFDPTTLGSARRMRDSVGRAYGSMKTALLDGVRGMDITKYERVRSPTPQAARLARVVAQADPNWAPEDARFWTMGVALRDAANAGSSQASAWENSELLCAWRLNTSVERGHVHHQELVAKDKRRRCILDCEECTSGLETPHGRSGHKASVFCTVCGVYLSIVPREYFGGRSSWVVFHEDREFPRHVYAAAAAAAAPPPPQDGDDDDDDVGVPQASGGTDSARKRRNRKKYQHVALQEDNVKRALFKRKKA